MTPAEEAAVHAAIVHLRGRAVAADHYRSFSRPAPGSAENTAIRRALGNDAGLMAELLLMSADYHLLTFAASLSTGELYPFGGYSLLRGAAEPAARAAWLMDPAISAQDRLRRVLVERLYSLEQQDQFEHRKKHVEKRRATLEADAEKLSQKLLPKTKDRRQEHFGQPRPGATRLFGQLLPDIDKPGADPIGADVYRWLSGYAHSVPWAIFAEGESMAGGEPGFGTLKLELRIVFQMVLLDHVLTLHDIAHRRLAARASQPEDLWDQTIATVPPRPDLRALLATL